ncbi:helix-turn-helix domain-containing protein [Amycolatopsis jejuensis]|uniref:helix-turn-helix domain-containing protein n=1 Tax=Amycolatopsis jejuensis TaxID=330084 RepID=UPI000525F496|nr:helix-turn-helix domain-containing protein [Amycolatopsis jejuensis]
MTMIVPVLRTWMRAVSEISRAVNVAEPLEDILMRVAELARDLIGFDFCAVMLADPAADRLDITGWAGLSKDYLTRLRNDSSLCIHPDSADADSPAAQAFREAHTIAIPDVRRDTEVYGRLSLSSLQGYHSLVATPLKGAGKPIGVLVGYSAAPRRYGNADLELTELLAEQTVTAIHAAQFRARREWAEEQHHRLMQLVLDEAGLAGLVDALADVLTASVAVIDTEDRLLAAAGERAAGWQALPRLPAAPGLGYATRHIEDEGHDAWVTPVVICGEVAASLWVLGDQAVPDTTRRRLVEQFALVVGIEMLTVRHALEIEERLSGDLLSDVLRGESLTRPRVLRQRGTALGFDLDHARNVVLFAGEGIQDHVAAIARYTRNAVRAKVLATSYGDDVVLLVPEVRGLPGALDRVRQQLPGPLVTVISPPVERLGDIHSAYRAASGAARLRTGGLVDLRDLSVLGLLLMADTPSVYLQRLAGQLIAPIAEQDERRDAQLLATLRAWLHSGFSVAQTATALTVHVNTVGQRLTRIEKLTAQDLKLADTRLDLQLALHVWDILHS